MVKRGKNISRAALEKTIYARSEIEEEEETENG